jgi:hypothetical protein
MITNNLRELKRLIGLSGRQSTRTGGAARISTNGSAHGWSPHAISMDKESEEEWIELDRLCDEIEASLKNNQTAMRAPLVERR